MKKKTRKILLIISIIVFVICASLLGYRIYQYSEQKKQAQEAIDMADADLPDDEDEVIEIPNVLLDDPMAIQMSEIDLDGLEAVNPEVLGWIYISNTDMSFPLLQHSDNQYYLNTSWDLLSRFYGAIFLECECSPDFSDFNTIIYGHNLYNGGMFHDVRYFRTQEYYDEHPYIYIRTDDDVRRYDIFACYEAKPVSPVYYLHITKEEHKTAVLDFAAEHSMIETGLTPTIDDHIITLSTCTGTGSHEKRIVVQALLAESISLDDLNANKELPPEDVAAPDETAASDDAVVSE